ncbi:MAG TPA: PAS domain S-box protein [Pyrinomonadaceae bacterium]
MHYEVPINIASASILIVVGRDMPGVSRLKVIALTALIACMTVSLSPSVARAQRSAVPKRVLVLYWYSKDFPWNVKFDQTFQAALQSARPKTAEYYPEYLESNRFPGENQTLLFHDYLKHKYADRPMDVVVANSDASLDFLLKYRSDLFPQAAMVFVATRRPTTEQLAAGPGVTGIINLSGFKKTLDLALKLHPGTQQAYVISGTLQHDKKFETLAREQLRELENRVEITYLTDLPVHELIAKVKKLPERSIVLYVSQQSQDKQETVLESGDIFASIAPSTKVPIYGMTPSVEGRGIIGGYINTPEGCGTGAAEIALQIANGTRALDIPIEPAAAVPIFDWRQLQRWGISEDQLPPGAIVRFREDTFWHLYKWRIVGAITIFILEAILIAILLVERRRLGLARAALDERLHFETLLSELSAEFTWLPANEVNSCIAKWIDRLSRFFSVDDGAIIDLPRNAISSNDHPLESLHPLLEGFSKTQLTDFLGQLSSGLTVNLSRLPQDSTDTRGAGKKVLSLFAVPISVNGLIRALVFYTVDSNHVWSQDLVVRLRMIGEIFSESLSRKHQETELRASEERFATAFRSNPQPMSITTLREDRYLDVNDSFLGISGFARNEVIGRTSAELNIWETPVARNEFVKRLETHWPLRNFETKFRTKSGAFRIFLSSAELLNLGGERCLLVASSDITDRKKLEDDLMRLTSRLFNLQDEERRRIARELHDDTAQNLFAISINLAKLHQRGSNWGPEELRIIEECETLGNHAMREIRTLSYLLHPPLLDQAGLVSALQWYVEGFIKRSDIYVDLFLQDIGRLDSELETALFRIVQEGLTNIHRHSGSVTGSIRLESKGDRIILQIKDEGHGVTSSIPVESVKGIYELGVGIPGMQQRLRQLGGELDVVSNHKGTIVTAAVPVRRRAGDD